MKKAINKTAKNVVKSVIFDDVNFLHYAFLSNVFYAYATELTRQTVNSAHIEALNMFIKSTSNNTERNILHRIENANIMSAIERSNLTTKSNCLNHALTEFRTMHKHVEYINSLNARYLDKITKKELIVKVDANYVERHIKHNCSNLKNLFIKEVNAENVKEFRVVEKEQVSVFK